VSKFTFTENDPAGLNTLQAVGQADKFNRWMYQEVRPWMQGSILEIGSGIGNISEFFIRDKATITLTDIRPHYLDHLAKRFPDLPADKRMQMDLVDPDFGKKFAPLQGTFDSAFALNVIEHINDDGLAVRNLHTLLKPDGTFLMLVPAHPWLYNRLDHFLHHFRRYTETMGRDLFFANGFTVDRTWFFNSLGIPAWWWGGLTGRSGEIRPSQMEIYNRLVPLIRVMDSALGKGVGLSVLVAGRKK
jgi:SAM-dependent methyltransferase